MKKEVTEKTDETQVGSEAVKTSHDTLPMSLPETLGHTRNNLHEELGLMLQVETQTTEAEIWINQEKMGAKLGLK
jgi:hypothetical protein